jgi:hypothetical protein
MPPDASRRGFLLRGLAAAPPVEPDPWDDFFGSYEQACAQVNEAKPFLADEARRLGIPTEGRSDLDVLKDVFRSTGRPRGDA